MWFARFQRSIPGRVLCAGLGLSLVAYGGTHPSLFGLVLMMVGMVPMVTGLAGICLLEEVVHRRRAKDRPPGRPRERRA